MAAEDLPPSPSSTSAQRRLLTVAGGLGVAVLAGAAFALTYEDLRTLALAGGAARRWAPAYPVMTDALITVTVLALVAARRTRWWSRGLRWGLLVALLGGAAAASVQRAVKGYGPLPDQPLKAGVAVAPHVMILIAVWLWLTMFKQVRTAPAAASASIEPVEPGPEDEEPDEIIPGMAEAAPPPPAEDPRVPDVPVRLTEASDDDPTPPGGFMAPYVPPAALPSDVELVRSRPISETTQPDIVVPPEPGEDDDAEPAVDRAEDPDGGDDDDDGGEAARRGRHRLRKPVGPPPQTVPDLDTDEVARWTSEDFEPDRTTTVEWPPPSSNFRSSPTPPQD